MKPDAATFIDALHRLEQSRDADTIAGLFADNAEISNPLVAQEGKDGAAAFWTAYRSAFDQIESTFASTLEQEGRIALEWKSTGTVKGKNVAYEGGQHYGDRRWGDHGLPDLLRYRGPRPRSDAEGRLSVP